MGTYQQPNIGRPFFCLVFGIFGVAAAGIIVAGIANGFSLFEIIWLAGLPLPAYTFLHRLAYKVSVDPTSVHWETPLRGGDVPMSELTGVRMGRALLARVLLIEHRGGRITVLPRKGIADLAGAIAQHRPDLAIGPIQEPLGGRMSTTAWTAGPPGAR